MDPSLLSSFQWSLGHPGEWSENIRHVELQLASFIDDCFFFILFLFSKLSWQVFWKKKQLKRFSIFEMITHFFFIPTKATFFNIFS